MSYAPGYHPDDFPYSTPRREDVGAAVARLKINSGYGRESQRAKDIRTLVEVAERAQEELQMQENTKAFHEGRYSPTDHPVTKAYHEKAAHTAEWVMLGLRRILGMDT